MLMSNNSGNFGDKLYALRRGRGLSQRELASALRDLGIQVTNQAVSKWENGTTQPNASQFLALCRILDVRDVLSVFLGDGEYSSSVGLNAMGVKKLGEYAELLRLSGLYDENAPSGTGEKRLLPVYSLANTVSGSNWMDSGDYEMLEVDESVPLAANFGVIQTGDSMEPDYHDGETIWMQQSQVLIDGRVGVFFYRGGAYLKRLRDRVGGIRLQSINRSYPDVVVTEPSALRVFGYVI